MSNTLPPGWTGTMSRHSIDIGGLRLTVTDRDFRWDDVIRWGWLVESPLPTIDRVRLLKSNEAGIETAALARADGLAAVEGFARKLLDEVAKLRTEAT